VSDDLVIQATAIAKADLDAIAALAGARETVALHDATTAGYRLRDIRSRDRRGRTLRGCRYRSRRRAGEPHA
jgi:hypothetical protein